MPYTQESVKVPAISKYSEGNIFTYQADSDKSISHRSLILTSQAIGTSKIYNILESEDVLHSLDALRMLGVTINKLTDENNQSYYKVEGLGIGGLKESRQVINCGNAGTACRLLIGLVSSMNFKTFFTGDSSLSTRPMKRIMEPLSLIGSKFIARNDNNLPLLVIGNQNLIPLEYELPIPSAQLKSAILLAALNIAGETIIHEPILSRDHTEIMLESLGATLTYESDNASGRFIKMRGQQNLYATDIEVPGDPSSAAFLVAAAILTKNSDLTLKNILINPHRIGLYEVLKEMGADITFLNKRTSCNELIADIRIKTSELHGITITQDKATAMIDEYPILSVLASFAKGETIMLGLSELKVKESNRLQAMFDGLQQLGVNVSMPDDESLKIIGNNNSNIVGGSEHAIKTHYDHRIAMSFLIMGLRSEKGVLVDDSSAINTSFPSFFKSMNLMNYKINFTS